MRVLGGVVVDGFFKLLLFFPSCQVRKRNYPATFLGSRDVRENKTHTNPCPLEFNLGRREGKIKENH